MQYRNLFVFAGLIVTSAAFADSLVFTSPNFAGNTTARNNWLSAIGITTPTQSCPFDELPNGNISGVVNIYPGLTITASTGGATVTDSPALMGNSNPIGLKAVAVREGALITLAFGTPVDYFSVIHMDLSTLFVTANYTDGTTGAYSGSGSGSSGNTGVFFGLYKNDRPSIASIVLRGTGGDGEGGLDNVEFGRVVPEPVSAVALGLGAALLIRRKRV